MHGANTVPFMKTVYLLRTPVVEGKVRSFLKIFVRFRSTESIQPVTVHTAPIS